MKCPYCNNGISYYSHPGFRWPCTICDGTGEMNEKEKTETQNKKIKTQTEMVSSQDDQRDPVY